MDDLTQSGCNSMIEFSLSIPVDNSFHGHRIVTGSVSGLQRSSRCLLDLMGHRKKFFPLLESDFQFDILRNVTESKASSILLQTCELSEIQFLDANGKCYK